jgi:acetyl-CoA synthetase
MSRISTIEEYYEQYKRSVEDPEAFWAEQASSFTWKKKWDQVLEWNFSEPSV